MGAVTSANEQQRTDVKIKLNKKTHLFLPGEIVSGKVYFNRLRYRNRVISIDLIGEVGYTMNKSNRNGTDHTTHYHYPFFTVSKTSIMNGENFDLCLDQNLPPSVNLEKGIYPYIRYLLQVNLSKTKKHRHWIVVCPHAVIPRSTIHPVYFDAFNSKQMRLIGSIDVEWILPGDRFQIEFQINNPYYEPIQYIDGCVIMRAKFKDDEYSEKVMDIVIDNVYDMTEEQITDSIPLVFPFNYYPPTCHYTNHTHTFYVTIEYWVNLEVHLRDALHNLKTSIPLIVGFEPDQIGFNELSKTEQQQQHLSSRRLHISRAFRKHHS